MDYVVDRNIPVKQAADGIVISILTTKEKATSALRIEVPQQYAHAFFGE